MKKKGANILDSILNALQVSHTQKFSNKYYNEHPHKYNLLGISQMLSDYGVHNAGIKIENKFESVCDIQCPFVAQVGGNFAVIYHVYDNTVEYRSGNLNFEVTRENFCESWSGAVLLVESDGSSIEPDFKINLRTGAFHVGMKSFLFSLIIIVLLTKVIPELPEFNFGLGLSFFTNIAGIYIGILLLQKQLNIHSSYTDKICSILKHADCNNILESDEAKLWGIVSWNEVGFSYFLSNLLIIVFFRHLIFFYAAINVCTLPFTIWSIWFQKFKAKQWCVLCLIVQVLLWSIFITNIVSQYFYVPNFGITDIIILSCIYFIPFTIITLLLPLLSRQSKIENITQEINSLKSHEGVLSLFLKEQPYYPSNKLNSQILFGNKEAKLLLTILTNPHCPPCGKMHDRVEKILRVAPNNFCIQYIFSSFTSSFDISNKFLIAAYQNSSTSEIEAIYKDWFLDGKFNKEVYFEKFKFNLNAVEVVSEFEKHQTWLHKTKLELTPTIMLNGYKLPPNYQIEDLKYVTEILI